MSTRRPNVPRAPKQTDSAAQGRSGAEVLHPKFGHSKTAPQPGPAKPASGTAGTNRPARSKSSSGADSSGSTAPSAAKESSARTKAAAGAGPTSPSKARPVTAAARRVQERESAKYSVRQPVIGWVKGDGGPTGGAKTPQNSAGGSTGGSGASAAAGTSPVPAKSFSGRLLALTVVLITITVLLAPTVRVYVEQRAELAALEAQIAEQEATQVELNKQLARWEDPAYIKQQARYRLFLVMPGETRYLVMGAEGGAEAPQTPGSDAGPADLPWVDALWQSIERSATE